MKFRHLEESSAAVSVTWGSWNRGMRRTVKSEREVKALAAVSLWPSTMYAVKVSTLTSVGMAFRMKLRCDNPRSGQDQGHGQRRACITARALTTDCSSMLELRGHSTAHAAAGTGGPAR